MGNGIPHSIVCFKIVSHNGSMYFIGIFIIALKFEQVRDIMPKASSIIL